MLFNEGECKEWGPYSDTNQKIKQTCLRLGIFDTVFCRQGHFSNKRAVSHKQAMDFLVHICWKVSSINKVENSQGYVSSVYSFWD